LRHRIHSATCLGPGDLFLIGRTLFALSAVEEGASVQAVPEAPPLTVRVEARDGHLFFEVFPADACVSACSISYEPAHLRQVMQQLQQLAATSYGCRAGREAAVSGMVKDFGLHIVEHFVPRPIRKVLNETRSDGVQFVLAPEVARFPWELMFLEKGFLCLNRCVGKQAIFSNNAPQAPIPRADGPPKVLFVVNPTEDLPEVQSHGESLFNMVEGLAPGLEASFLSGKRAQRIDLLRRLSSTDVVYYVGHAEYDAQSPEQSAWILNDGRITSADFRKLERVPKIIFANACESGREATWTASRLLTSEPLGLASGLIFSGASAYVGALWPIPASPSLTFAREFLLHLFSRQPVGSCVRKARLRAFEAHECDGLIWAAYTLFGNIKHVLV